jgi:hypothetical protein
MRLLYAIALDVVALEEDPPMSERRGPTLAEAQRQVWV